MQKGGRPNTLKYPKGVEKATRLNEAAGGAVGTEEGGAHPRPPVLNLVSLRITSNFSKLQRGLGINRCSFWNLHTNTDRLALAHTTEVMTP